LGSLSNNKKKPFSVKLLFSICKIAECRELECLKNQPAIFKAPTPRFFRRFRKLIQLL